MMRESFNGRTALLQSVDGGSIPPSRMSEVQPLPRGFPRDLMGMIVSPTARLVSPLASIQFGRSEINGHSAGTQTGVCAWLITRISEVRFLGQQ